MIAKPPAALTSSESLISVPRPAILVAMVTIPAFPASVTISASFLWSLALSTLAQAQHGSAPDIAGQGIANPSSLIGSTAMLFHWLGQKHNCPKFQTAAAQIDWALESVLSDPAKRTRDLGGPLGTEAFTDALITALGHD